MKKDILTLADLDSDTLETLLDRAIELKKRRREGISDRPLVGKTLGLIFDKPSTRTRISFEAAAAQLGATPLFINASETQMSRNEPVKDTARVLSRYLDAVAIRTYSQEQIEEFACYASISVINALTDRFHPCQVLSDLMTVIEAKGGCRDIKIAWVGDGNNVAHSWINAAAVLGLNLVLACPEGYLPDADILEKARQQTGGRIELTSDPEAAVAGADVVYTDVWASMGQEGEQAARLEVFQAFQVNASLLAKAARDVIVMHCLPAHRNEEISEAVLEGSQSVVWDQSENKLHLHKAVLEYLMAS